MKVIFLDIDGVLNLIPQGYDRYGGIFHKHFEDNLRYIIEQTDAKIVLSSTWRMSGLSVIQRMWKDRCLAGEVIDITPIGFEYRGLEIQHWLDHNIIENYVIIDDDTDMMDEQMDNFVQTSENSDHPDCVDIGYGLTRLCAEKAIKILNRREEQTDRFRVSNIRRW